MAAEPFPLLPSLWHATAVPAPSTPALTQAAETEIAIVGAGYAGLSTALHLAQKGIGTVVLEAREPGWGGSGRNGGQVIPGLKYDPDELEEKFGPTAGAAMADFMGRTADNVFRLIEQHRMDVPHVRNGWIQGAHSRFGLTEASSRAAQWQRRGVDAKLLDRAGIADHLGNDAYLGGWLDPRGGAIQPLSFARELCRAAQAAGAVVHGNTPVERIASDGSRWKLTTRDGLELKARKVVVCTNGYTKGLVPGIERTIIAPNSFQIASTPLSDNLRKSILPYGQVTSDTRKLLLYFRLDHQGRLLMGGRGPFREPTGERDWAQLVRVISRFYPQLQGTGFEYRWCGRVAITRDFLPHLHEPEQGLIVNLGCQGRGVGLETSMGIALADYCATGRSEALPFPITPVKPIPFHALRQLYVAATVAWYRLSDAALN
jgi:glycine/D-amino acid oxidase-like deaminating enzyme